VKKILCLILSAKLDKKYITAFHTMVLILLAFNGALKWTYVSAQMVLFRIV